MGRGLAVATLLAIVPFVAAAQGTDVVARLERIEGGGMAQVGTLADDALQQAEASGELTVGQLADRGLTPNWVLTALFNLEAEGVQARDHTLARLTVDVPAIAASLELQRPAMAGLEAALPHAAEAERRSYRDTLDAFARSEGVLDDLRRLLGFLESRAYLSWLDVAAGHPLRAGETIRVGAGAVAVVRYGTGALVRVGGDTTLEVAPRTVARPATGDVAARLWRGIADFYVPPGGEHGVGTARAVIRVRGTEFRVRHEDGVTSVEVSSGAVEVTELFGGAPVGLAAGDARAFGAAAGPTVAGGSPAAGWREVIEGGVRVAVPEAWQRAPGLTLWWIGDDPEDPWGVLGFGETPDFDAARDLGDAVVAQAAAQLGGLPATRYDLRWQEDGFVVYARYLALDAALPDGGRPLFTGFWRDTHPYEPEVERFLASVRFGDAPSVALPPVLALTPPLPPAVAPTPDAVVAPTAPTDASQWLAGGWRADTNGYPGTLTFGRTAAGWVGVLNRQESPEDLTDIVFHGNEIRFVRPLGAYTQAYRGSLELDGATWRLSGTFDQGGAGAYPWRAERPVDPVRLLTGSWRVDLNGYGGTVAFEPGADGWIVTLTLAGGEPERLTDVTFDGAEIGFVRPLGELTQVYWGVLDRYAATVRLHGRFGHGAVEAYRWWAEREVGPGE